MTVLEYISVGIGTAAVAVIVWGALRVFARAIVVEFAKCKGGSRCCHRESLRQEFGSYLLLALEFLIAADIVGTVADPTLEEMAVLASIVAIRTVISFFLNKELATQISSQAPDNSQ